MGGFIGTNEVSVFQVLHAQAAAKFRGDSISGRFLGGHGIIPIKVSSHGQNGVGDERISTHMNGVALDLAGNNEIRSPLIFIK